VPWHSVPCSPMPCAENGLTEPAAGARTPRSLQRRSLSALSRRLGAGTFGLLLTSAGRGSTIGTVPSAEIDAYLADVDEPKRSTLQRLRQTILEVIPDAEEGISYGLPAFRVQGTVVAGFAAFKNHLS
jgi:hypothetical protein